MKKLFYVVLMGMIATAGIITLKQNKPEFSLVIFAIGGITVAGIHLADSYTKKIMKKG